MTDSSLPLTTAEVDEIRKLAPQQPLVQRLCDTIDHLRAAFEEMAAKEQSTFDRSVYYRNIALQAGADPEVFDSEYDRALARDKTLSGCCPHEAEVCGGKVLWRGPADVLEGADSYGIVADLPPGTEVAVVLVEHEHG